MIPSQTLSMILYEAKTKLNPTQEMKSVTLQRQSFTPEEFLNQTLSTHLLANTILNVEILR